ncbi:MAG: type III pantothenate kinase [Gallionellaceae bacterium]|jgi:type III pantothenate kinase
MLLIDAGNSRCKWTWTENGIWLRQGVLDNTDSDAWRELKKILSVLGEPQKILISNVAGVEMEQRLRDLCAIWSSPVQLIAARAAQCGVRNLYEHPAQLGSDRWAALIAGWQHARQACLVVSCGTATTVDALSGKGDFVGGLILPGIALMQRSLLASTAQLAHEENKSQGGSVHDFPLNTRDAILSGAMRATIAAIQYQYRLLEAQQQRVQCLLTGGAASYLMPHLGLAAEQVDNLVLHGLQLIGQDCLNMTGKETVAR